MKTLALKLKSSIQGNRANRTRGYEEDALNDSNQILPFLHSDCIMNARPSLGLELSSLLAPPTPPHISLPFCQLLPHDYHPDPAELNRLAR